MANNSAMRVGVITAVQLAAAMAIVLWPVALWPQTNATPALTTPVSPTAEDRKSFADAENRRIEKTLAEILPDAVPDKGFAEGPDATYYVWYITPGPADAFYCKGYSESYTSRLSKYGFTRLIYNDKKGGSCEIDPVTRKVTTPSTFLPPAEEAKQIWETIQDAKAVKQAIVAEKTAPQDRKEYAEFMGRGNKGSSVSAEGPDSTYYVFHTSKYSMTESTCASLFTDGVTAKLSELGFTKVICTDKKNASFSFDPAVPIVRQHPLPPGAYWAEGTVGGYFGPTLEQKVDPRSGPAKATSEEASALTSKSYVQIGTIRAQQPGKKGDAEVMQQIEAAILKKAAESGGDVVRFSSEGATEIVDVPTGKTKTKKECAETAMVRGMVKQTKFCVATSAGPLCSYGTEDTGPVEVCVKYEKREVPITRKEQRLVSEGTVWRNDPKLAADIARPATEAARKAEAARQNRNLEQAILAGNLEKVRELLKENPDVVFGKDEEGFTPLGWAAGKGNKDAAELLLANNADVNAKTKDGGTPLCLAAAKGRKDVAELLLANKADVNAKNNDGWTPLHYAADYGQKDVAELLLAKGASINAKADDGSTPLSLAAAKGHQDVAKMLQQHGGHE